MDSTEIVIPILAAIVGGIVVEIVNFGRLVWNWFMRANLRISGRDDLLILSHQTQLESGEWVDEEIYGFSVDNDGRRIATGVRFQLIKIECRSAESPEFTCVSEHAYDLSMHRGAERARAGTVGVLVPGSSLLIELGRWREDYDVVFPSVESLPDYYEEICASSIEYRFSVVAFDGAHFVKRILKLSKTRARRGRAAA